MSAEPIVIVGAGAAALACARAYREHGGRARLMMVGEEPIAPYRRPPLSKEFLRGELAADELTLEGDGWFAENEVELRLDARVSEIDAARGTATVHGEEIAARTIVLATGSETLRDGIPGIEHPAVMTLRTLADSTRLAERAPRGSNIVVLGTGFVGCEVAASLAVRGANVTLVGEEALPHARRLGDAAALRLARWLREAGVSLAAEVEVETIDDGRALVLADGSRIAGDVLVVSIGARPRSELARSAGLALSGGAVCVDAQMRVPATAGRVMAVGDVAAAENAAAGRRLRVEHWGEALEHGKVAGLTLAGVDASWNNVPGFWSTIGSHTVKYAAWGDGYAQAHLIEHGKDAFTVWYSDDEGNVVGVLAHECDADYERGRQMIAAGAAGG